MKSTLLFVLGLIVSSGIVNASVEVNPQQVGFGSVLVGSSAHQNVTLTNLQTEDQNLVLKYLNSIDFRFEHNCPSVLKAGEGCQIHVSFAPVLNWPVYSAVEVYTQSGKQTIDIYGSGFEIGRPTPIPVPFPTPFPR